jgi:hypothetical protein
LIDFIHIGYHKTGTTWLQNQGLRKHPDIILLNYSNNPKARTVKVPEVHELIRQLYFVHDFDFQPDYFREKFNEIVSKYKTSSSVIGISYEFFSGDFYNGNDSARIANRVLEVFGPTKIIIVIRNQIDMIEATYKQYIHSGGTLSIKQFLDKDRFPVADLIHRLQYDKLVNYYQQLYCKENVFVGLYELFEHDKEKFMKDLYGFIGVESKSIYGERDLYLNKSHHKLTLKLDRIINLLFNNRYSLSLLGDGLFKVVLKSRRGYLLPIGTIWRRIIVEKYIDPIMYYFFKSKPLLSNRDKKEIGAMFSESNYELTKMLDMDIAKYGYPIGNS